MKLNYRAWGFQLWISLFRPLTIFHPRIYIYAKTSKFTHFYSYFMNPRYGTTQAPAGQQLQEDHAATIVATSNPAMDGDESLLRHGATMAAQHTFIRRTPSLMSAQHIYCKPSNNDSITPSPGPKWPPPATQQHRQCFGIWTSSHPRTYAWNSLYQNKLIIVCSKDNPPLHQANT